MKLSACTLIPVLADIIFFHMGYTAPLQSIWTTTYRKVQRAEYGKGVKGKKKISGSILFTMQARGESLELQHP
jgi:hypothetical protein